MGKIKNVLWVCFGNTARSPAAWGISQLLKNSEFQEELKDVNFDSAGFVNVFKQPQEDTKKYLESKGMDISNFRGKAMDSKLLEKQDLILAMETRHIKRLKKKFKNVKNIDSKAFLLLEFAGKKENLDIDDPINIAPEEYKIILEEVEWGVRRALEKIIQINKRDDWNIE
jgi:protein-tyrosine-phosphatase